MEPQVQNSDSLPRSAQVVDISANQPIPPGAPQFLPPAPDSAQAVSGAALPVAATDSDLIENEWVDAVKAVIEGHKDDPYIQSKAMLMLRVDYMKKRYGKDIKIPEN